MLIHTVPSPIHKCVGYFHFITELAGDVAAHDGDKGCGAVPYVACFALCRPAFKLFVFIQLADFPLDDRPALCPIQVVRKYFSMRASIPTRYRRPLFGICYSVNE